MSQAGILNVISTNPSIPTEFITNSGTAGAVFNVINILGDTAQGVSTSSPGSSNTILITVANATTSSKGVAQFDPADFSVTAGVVSLSGTGSLDTLTGNDAVAVTPTAGNINVITSNTTVKFTGLGSTLTQDFGKDNLFIGNSAPGLTTGIENCCFGKGAGNALTSGDENVLIGRFAGLFLTTSIGNVAIGESALSTFTSGAANGGSNVAIGLSSLGNLLTGIDNIAIGAVAGNGYSAAESSNISIGALGTAGESNVTRIGTQGSGTGQQNKCVIAGITGVTTSNSQMVTIDTTTGQLGAATISGGTVTSVTGTTNRITSTGGTTPAIDISASYVGQSSITTLGTIATGVWHGTVIDLSHGGTNANLTASNGGIFYSTASAGAILSGTATAGQIIRSGATAAPTWSTTTYPATNAINTVLYASAANVMSALATANSGVLATSPTGVPSISTTPTVTSITFGSGTALNIFVTGTFTPNLLLGGAAVGMSYAIRQGSYTQIGDMIIFAVYISLSTLGSSTGNASITGFPQNCGNSNGIYYTCPVNAFFAITCNVGYSNIYGNFVGGTAQMNLTQIGTAQAFSAALSNTNMGAQPTIAISGFYKTS